MKRRSIECAVLILALVMSLASVTAFAAPAVEDAALLMEDVEAISTVAMVLGVSALTPSPFTS